MNGFDEGKVRLAVDYGTTTVGYAYVSENGDVVDTGMVENPGRKYGRDVLSRIKAYSVGAGERITGAMREVISSLSSAYPGGGDISFLSDDIVVSANTVMNHMLLGYPCEGLAAAPYTAQTLEAVHYRDDGFSFRTLPGFSPFVGGDIVSGVKSLGMDESDEINLLIDLGTNGEMVLGNKEGFIVSSVAAGPAFEEWGAAHNMYGSGVIDICYRLLRTGIIDKNGTFVNDAYIESGFPVSGSGESSVILTQDDIRDIQLAKAAVRAGVELLVSAYGISYDDISHVFLAGGMGEHLSVGSAIGIGMLPEGRPVIESVGNTSLSGAIKEAIHPDPDRLFRITKMGRPILLSDDPLFNETFVKHMSF